MSRMPGEARLGHVLGVLGLLVLFLCFVGYAAPWLL